MWGSQNSGYRTKLFFVPHKLLGCYPWHSCTKNELLSLLLALAHEHITYVDCNDHLKIFKIPICEPMDVSSFFLTQWLPCTLPEKNRNKTCETPKNSMGQKQAIIIKNSCWEASAVYFSRQHTKNVCPAAWWWFPLTKNEVTIYPKLSRWDKL